jgi:hypothetical protein
MGNRERLLTLALGAVIAALGLIFSGTAMADSVQTFQSSTPPYKDPAGNTWTDPRGAMPNRTGTLVEARYGPYTVNANSQVHNALNFSAPAPCQNCYITDIVPNLVYDGNSPDGSPNGTEANLNSNMMMHHFVLSYPNRTDTVCPSGLQTNILGTPYERFFAAGNERSEIHLPTPYGYQSSSPTYLLIYHLVNKDLVQNKKVSIQVIFRYRSDPPQAQSAKPLWLDIDGCGDSEYTIPTGYSNSTASWTSTVSGRMVGIGGHQHDVDITGGGACDTHCPAEGGGVAISAELVGGSSSDYFGPIPPNNPPPASLTGATLCRSQDYYGTSWAGSRFKGHLDTMSQCGINTDLPGGAQAEAYPAGGGYPTSGYKFTSGQAIKLHSEYQNNTGFQQTDVMGIMAAWYAPLEPGYPRPKGATPNLASLVVAYQPCTGGTNRQHGGPPPFNALSCNPPVQSSNELTVGTGDANPGTTPKAVGSVRFDVVPDNGGTPATDESNLKIKLDVTDVRRKSDLADYTGQLKENTLLRIIDRDNGPSEVGVTQDIPLGYTVPCTATSADNTVGSTCSVNTTANAVLPGTVKGGKRSIWQMAKVDLYDGGADGVANTEPNTLFMTQGLWVP